jgi:hypothetical protein
MKGDVKRFVRIDRTGGMSLSDNYFSLPRREGITGRGRGF